MPPMSSMETKGTSKRRKFCVNWFSVYTRNWSCRAPNASKRGLSVVSRRKCGDRVAKRSKSQIAEPGLRTVQVINQTATTLTSKRFHEHLRRQVQKTSVYLRVHF